MEKMGISEGQEESTPTSFRVQWLPRRNVPANKNRSDGMLQTRMSFGARWDLLRGHWVVAMVITRNGFKAILGAWASRKPQNKRSEAGGKYAHVGARFC